MKDIPPIEGLIPHRGSMLLLGRVRAFEERWAVGECFPESGAWYADESGNMPAWIGIELMAQTAAAHVTLARRMEGLAPKMGVLLGTRAYRSEIDAFGAGILLEIRANQLFMESDGLGAYECSIASEGRIRARAILKVFEPGNVELFLQGYIS
ncbi:MAG: beta-hydroxyacyl-ACP dehydratase [Candidatus Accumulibacter sp.]|jgi:predicted hotdog family 3-hydroxylacyl-ACP dehydratase|nr:beta-hydroxyacyl-ACP dehydratase [Accumulibacter sp.]